jgi:X-Pro dipeptidyl-peptidase (S15 family)/X-Pro dipeptidyl-peptidase C-terminal non-catalytic domain
MAFFALLAPGAGAQQVSSVLGIPCTTQANGVQACIGDTAHRVKSWDGVPLDVNVWLPPAAQHGPFPLIASHHGWGGSKSGDPSLALQGYAVLAYTARGFGNSCGSAASRAADPAGCARGWVHLDDARFEARDTQTLAGRLADLGLVKPRRIGVTGSSYGGGLSFILATLRNRIMLPDGSLARWRSPQGKKMKIAAAVPLWGWSDLAYALTPNGNTLDYLRSNPYGDRIGVSKQSWLTLLYAAGLASGFYAPVGADPDADLTGWFNRISLGEPYDDAASRDVLDEFTSHHSAYYLQSGLPWWKRRAPAPILAYNSWLDDLFPADEPLRYRQAVLSRHPWVEFSLLFAAGAGHPRAPLSGTTPDLAELTTEFWARHLKGAKGKPLGVRTYTQNCNGSPLLGPFDSRTWRGQQPGEVRLNSPAAQTFSGVGGDPAVAAAIDPTAGLGSNSCHTRPAVLEPNTATYNVAAATGNGYTLVGSPTVIARLAVSGSNAQVDARLWDVAPSGSQSFVTRGILRPKAGTGTAVFQLHPNGWHFAPGHVARLQLLGRDAPYARASNGAFTVTASNLQLRLPVHDRPGGQVQRPLWPLDRDGTPARWWELAWR